MAERTRLQGKTQQDLEDEQLMQNPFVAAPGLAEAAFQGSPRQMENKFAKDSFDATVGAVIENEEEDKKEQAQEDAENTAIGLDRQKKQAQAQGDKTPDPEVIDEFGTTVDNNPNNQTKTAGERNDILTQAFATNPEFGSLQQILQEDKAREKQEISVMQDALNTLATRPVGVDLSPLAGLIDDPNKAKLLAKLTKPDTSPEDHVRSLLSLGQAIEDRKSQHSKSRRDLARKINDQRVSQAAKRAKEDRDLNFKQEKTIRDQGDKFRSVNGKTIDAYNSLGVAVNLLSDPANLDVNGLLSNPMASQIATISVAKATLGGGVLSDRDLDRFKRGASLMNQWDSLSSTARKGVTLTPQDQLDLMFALEVTAETKHNEIVKAAKAKAKQLEGQRSLGLRSGDLTKSGAMFDVDAFAPPDVLNKTREARRNLQKAVGVFKKSTPSPELNKKPVQDLTEAEADAEFEELKEQGLIP